MKLITVLLICQICMMFIVSQNPGNSPPNILEAGKRGVIATASFFYDEVALENIKEKVALKITYRQFFAEDLFKEIDNYIAKNKSDYRVVSIGIHPSIALYNGFYTLDGYSYNYPVEYKHKFRKIIEFELEKNKDLRNYYDDYGSEVVIFVDELGFLGEIASSSYLKDNNIKINNLDLNTGALADIGGKYIFSAAQIMNYEQNNLIYEAKFEDNNSAWDIYLYRVR